MMGYFYHQYNFAPSFAWLAPFVLLDLVLKGFALWKAAQRKQLYWFIALLIINSVGILPLIYLFITQNRKK